MSVILSYVLITSVCVILSSHLVVCKCDHLVSCVKSFGTCKMVYDHLVECECECFVSFGSM